jgi:hypothetical protein
MTSPEFDAWVEKARAIPIENIARDARLSLKRQGRELVGPCPRRGEGDDRFAIHVAEQKFNCRKCERGGQGGIDFGQFIWTDIRFLALVERLTGEPRPGKPKSNGKVHSESHARKIAVDRFDYVDENGSLKYQKERFEFQKSDGTFVTGENGKRKKTFLQRRPNPDKPGEWIYNLDDVTLLPYLLLELIDSDRTEQVWIFAGEAKTDRARREGLQATCASEGSASGLPN